MAKDAHDVGGTAVILRALLDSGHLDGSCLTVTGATIAETYGAAAGPDGAVVRSAAAPLASDDGLAVLKGNLRPDGALIKVAGLAVLVHERPARVFECEKDCVRAVEGAPIRPATCCSCAMKARSAAPGCARCSA